MGEKIEVLRLENLVRYFQSGGEEIRAVDGVDLTVYRGEMVSIMGASGSGKSSLLNLIGFLDHPQSGKIFFADFDVSSASEKTRQKLRLSGIGFIFQTFNLLPTLSALENVMLPLELGGIKNQVAHRRAQALLDEVGLGGKENRYPRELSSGENQRVAIARALSNQPILILADEPTGNLDSKNGELVMQILRHLSQERGITTIVVTHNPEVAALGDRNFQMKDGRLLSRELSYPAPSLSNEILLQ